MSVDNALAARSPGLANDAAALSAAHKKELLRLKKDLSDTAAKGLEKYSTVYLRTLQQWLSGDVAELLTAEERGAIGQRLGLEIERRTRLSQACSAGALLGHLHSDVSRADAAHGIFVSPKAPGSLADVKEFLAGAVSRPPGSQLAALTPDVAKAIRQYEEVAALIGSDSLSPSDIGKAIQAIPSCDPPSLASMYLDMSYEAAFQCMRRRMEELHWEVVGHHDVDDKLLTQPALRLLKGQDPFSFDKHAGHTLRHAMTQRIGQIVNLPGAERLSLDEIARRVAYSFRVEGFLTDINLPLEAANA